MGFIVLGVLGVLWRIQTWIYFLISFHVTVIYIVLDLGDAVKAGRLTGA